MAMTPAQLQVLKTAINAETDPEFVGYRTAGQTGLMANWFNKASTFIVWRALVNISEIGTNVNYNAVGALTTANSSRVTLFFNMNPGDFNPKADVRQFFTDTFSGALAGAGAETRAALEALWRRAATRVEKLFATGVGTDTTPGALVYVGPVSEADVAAAIAA